MLVLHANLHLFQSVAGIGGVQFVHANRLRIIGLNRDDSHASRLIVVRQFLDSALIDRRNRAVIAGEHDHQHGIRRVVAEFVDFAINTGKGKVRRRRP